VLNEHWLHLTGAEQIAKVAILTSLGRKKCSFLTQEKRPFLARLLVVVERILTVTQTEQSHKRNKIIARKIGSFIGAEAQ
jgi:hypothetical protein